MSQNHPRGQGVPKPADIDKVNFEKAYNIYKERFSNTSDFVFTLTGNINIDSIAAMLELYIASLPSKNNSETWKDLGIRPPVGDVKKLVQKGSDSKSMVSIVFTDTLTYSDDEAFYLKSLSELLNIRLIEVLREDLSGVYGVGASASLNRVPYQHYNITIRFPCSADNVDSLVNETMKLFNDICQNGVSEKNSIKIKETFNRQLEVNKKTNNYWLTNIENALLYKTNVLDILKEKEAIDALNAENIQNAACKYYSPQNIKVILIPE
jgi:zinc protease